VVGDAASDATYICTTADDSKVSACADGFWKDETGTADVCTEINECDGMTCGGAASTCVDGINQFTCNCGPGWGGGGVGQLCNDLDQCQLVVCGSSTSTCVDGDNQYTCNCGAGWSGGGVKTRCTADSCDASEAPTHGHAGTCTSDLPSGTSCQPDCDTNYILSGDSSCKEGNLNAGTCEHICSCADGGTATSGDPCPENKHCCVQPNGSTMGCTACTSNFFLYENTCKEWAPKCLPNQVMTHGPSNTQDRVCEEKCPDERSPHMIKKGRYCESWVHLKNMCMKSSWRSNKYCQQSCHALGFGYEDDECPVPHICSNNRSRHMVDRGIFCESWSHLDTMCARSHWSDKKFCQQSCFDRGLGYMGDEC